ncbi:MAG: hypothetical protein AB8B99_22155 [Phormidesmis sp.]
MTKITSLTTIQNTQHLVLLSDQNDPKEQALGNYQVGDDGESDNFAFDPFQGMNMSADGRQIVNQPDELEDFDIAQDCFLLNAADLGIERPITFVNGTADALAASGIQDANLVVIQGAFASAGAAAKAIAQIGIANGPGAFIYFNENLQINRLVYACELSCADAERIILGNIRSLTGEDALNALPRFSAKNFVLLDQPMLGQSMLDQPMLDQPIASENITHVMGGNRGPHLSQPGNEHLLAQVRDDRFIADFICDRANGGSGHNNWLMSSWVNNGCISDRCLVGHRAQSNHWHERHNTLVLAMM